MRIDAFLFFNEFDLLDLRLRELAGVVDRFVLVEATRTHSYQPKPLHFADHADRFSDYPITHVMVDDLPAHATPMEREIHQRNAIVRGLVDASDDDLVLLSDVDEIPRASAIPTTCHMGQCYTFEQDLYYYTMRHRVRGRWFGTRLVRVDALRAWTPQTVRHAGGERVRGSGWHFSYLGGVEAIQSKLAAFSHQEYNRTQFTDAQAISERVMAGRDLFDRNAVRIDRVEGIDHLPETVKRNPERYAHLLGDI